jgi:hypothetical protein
VHQPVPVKERVPTRYACTHTLETAGVDRCTKLQDSFTRSKPSLETPVSECTAPLTVHPKTEVLMHRHVEALSRDLTQGESLDKRNGRGHSPRRGPRPERPLPLAPLDATYVDVDDDEDSEAMAELGRCYRKFGTLCVEM